MKKILTIFLGFVLLAVATPAIANNKQAANDVVGYEVMGVVVDGEGKPVAGVVVAEKLVGVEAGAEVEANTVQTNELGEYVIYVADENATVVFNHDKYRSQEYLANSEALARVTLEELPKVLSIGFWDLFQGGGWLMWVLVLLAAVMIFIFVERFIAINKASQISHTFMNRIRDYISEGNIEAAMDLCRRTDSPIARMVEKGIERIGRPMGDIQTAIENVANVEVAKLETGIPWLASISGGAPMIGFLGTVVGMVQVFIDMSAKDGGGIQLNDLSAGMYVAMVTTVGGLLVGIPAYFAHNYLVARIEKLIFRMEATTIAFMDILNQPVQK